MVQAALCFLYDGSVFNNACHDIPWQSYRWRAHRPIMGELPEGDHFSKKNADINGDEKIDATDIVQLVNRVNHQ